jgi:hypothetical protein
MANPWVISNDAFGLNERAQDTSLQKAHDIAVQWSPNVLVPGATSVIKDFDASIR